MGSASSFLEGNSPVLSLESKGDAGRELLRSGPTQWSAGGSLLSIQTQFQRRKSLVNAAFLLVTAAWLSGADAAPATPAAPTAPAAKTVPAPIATTPISSAPIISSSGASCGGACGGCSDCGCDAKPSLFDRLRAMCQRNKDCGCETCKPVKCDTCNDCCEKKGLLSRLFNRKKECDICDTCGGSTWTAPIATPMSAPMSAPTVIPGGKMPEPIGKPMPDKKQTLLVPSTLDLPSTTGKGIETETQHPFELSRRYEARVDRAEDYSWITGQLFYVHADGGLWVVRYAPVGQEDHNGGGVILARNRGMDSYQEGDLVTVRGEILNEKGSKCLGAPLYRANVIQLVDRGQ